MSISSGVKVFPEFKREFFVEPKLMFEGWNSEDFARFVCEQMRIPFKGWGDGFTSPQDGANSFDGWLRESGAFLNSVSWVFGMRDDDGERQDMFWLNPMSVNEVLFPYRLFITKDEVNFLHMNTIYNPRNKDYSGKYFPFELVKRAMERVDLPLGKALLLESFVGVSPVGHVYEPVIDVKRLGLGGTIDEMSALDDVPFVVLYDFLRGLVPGSYDDVNPVCKHMAAYAGSVYYSGIG